MQTEKSYAFRRPQAAEYMPIQVQAHLSWREAISLLSYHLRLLRWWLFLLMALGFLASGGLLWLLLQSSDPRGPSDALSLSRFVLEPGAGLIAAMLASSLLVDDDALEVILTTSTSAELIVLWRSVLGFVGLLLCSVLYLAWSLDNGIRYGEQQSVLSLALTWLAPVLLMGSLGLLGSLVTRNASLGMVLAAIPLVSMIPLHEKLQPIQALHPFIIPYTFWGELDAPDWGINRLTLLACALISIAGCWIWLHREEWLVSSGR